MRGKHSAAVAARSRSEADVARAEAAKERNARLAAEREAEEWRSVAQATARNLSTAFEILDTAVRQAVEAERQENDAEREHTRTFLRRTLDRVPESTPVLASIDDAALYEILKPGPFSGRHDRRNLRSPKGAAAAWRIWAEDHPEDTGARIMWNYTPLARRYARELDGEDRAERTKHVDEIIAKARALLMDINR